MIKDTLFFSNLPGLKHEFFLLPPWFNQLETIDLPSLAELPVRSASAAAGY
jgi:hypothetical protein